MNEFQASIPVGTGGEAALKAASERFLVWGFAPQEHSAEYVRLKGPGLNSSRMAHARGASAVELALVDQELRLRAELGAADRMERFCRYFPIGLSAGLALILGTVFAFVFPFHIAAIAIVGTLATGLPWLFLGPWMGRKVQRDARAGLQSVLQHAQWVAQDASASERPADPP